MAGPCLDCCLDRRYALSECVIRCIKGDLAITMIFVTETYRDRDYDRDLNDT